MVFARPTLAMLGGFSAAVVYRIINRLVEAVDHWYGVRRMICLSRKSSFRKPGWQSNKLLTAFNWLEA
jgi:cobalamin biosynthesis protein CobD/CbiB